MTVPVVFTSPLAGAIYGAVFVVWLASIIAERAIIVAAGSKRPTKMGDRGSGVLIIGSILVSTFIAQGIASAGFAILPSDSFYLGIVMVLSGIVVRLWAVMTLRSFFSYTVQIKEGHQVIQQGPYRLVRHPAYTGSLLIILGLGFALQSLGSIAVMAITFCLTFGYRIVVEERLLYSTLGEEYASYARRVKRLIPYLF